MGRIVNGLEVPKNLENLNNNNNETLDEKLKIYRVSLGALKTFKNAILKHNQSFCLIRCHQSSIYLQFWTYECCPESFRTVPIS